MLVEVSEVFETAILKLGRSVLIGAEETGDVIVNELGRGCVVAHNNEARRNLDTDFLPLLECLFVVSVQGVERGVQGRGQAQWVEILRFAAPLFRHLPADVFPEIPEDRNFCAGDVVGYGDARELDDPAFDGIHEREIGHGPRKERALGIAGTAQEKRCSG